MESNRDIQTSIGKISSELTRIERWAIKWLVNFNIPKTVYMVFSNKPILILILTYPILMCDLSSFAEIT
jgi:hypothetical protein